jgi:hypothetical protein
MARPGILSREASRARIAAHVVPLTEAAGFPCLQADDEQARGWLRRLSLGQRLSAHEEGLCARLGRPPYAPESAASPDPGCGGQEGAAPAGPDSAHAALYGVLDAAGGPPILVLCAWSPAGDRLEPRRTVVLTGM